MPNTRATAKAQLQDSGRGDASPQAHDHVANSATSLRQTLQQFNYHEAPISSASRTLLQRKDSISPRESLKRSLGDSDANSLRSHRKEATPSPAKRRRESSKYAPPSRYAHLPKLEDILAPNLICVFVGTNPGIRTATAGHAYAHPSNQFWKLLHSSGCTDRQCRPEEDADLPRLYEMGNTNIVERPSRDAAELSKQEMAEGTPVLEAKIRMYRPEAVCIVGKGIWEAVWRYRKGKNPTKAEFTWGWQDDCEKMGRIRKNGAEEGEAEWEGARVFVASSTSGLSASLRPHEKEAIWKPFGEWVKTRRKNRAEQLEGAG